ncbi:MAG: YbfB/YjiJ family MFS transporter [Caldimonas sp.]
MRALALSGGAAVSVGFARFGYALILPAMRSDMALGYTAAGSLNTANAIGYFAGALLVITLAARMGDRPLFSAGLLLTTLSLLFCGFTRDIGWLLVWRFVSGLGAAGTFICGGVLAGRLGSRAVAAYFSGAGVGMIASGAALPWLFATQGALAWQAAWVWMGLACVPITVAAWWAAPREDGSAGEKTARAWPWQNCLPLLCAYGLFGMGYISYMTFMIAWLKDEGIATLSLAAATAALWCVLGAATLVAPRLWRPVVEERLDGRPMAWAIGCVAVGAALPMLLPNVFGILGSAILVGASVFMVPSAATLFTNANIGRAQQTPALAAMTVVFAAGQIAGPVFAGFLSDFYKTLDVGLGASAAVLALGSIVALLQRPLQGKQATMQPSVDDPAYR